MSAKNKTYAFLEFSTVKYFSYKGVDITVAGDYVIEVCAVKIAGDEISDAFHSYISIENYNANHIVFSDLNYSTRGVMAEHLIGAPGFKEVAERLHSYVKGCTLILRNGYEKSYERSAFNTFRSQAAALGFIFKNPIINMEDIIRAREFKDFYLKNLPDVASASAVELAQAFVHDTIEWTLLLKEYGIFFNPDEDKFPRDRDDVLSWTLALSKLFIALNEEDKDGRLTKNGGAASLEETEDAPPW